MRSEDGARATVFPAYAKEDRLRVARITPPSTNKIATLPNYAEVPKPKVTTATRKKRMREDEQEDDASEEQWRESMDGKWMIKRVRKHLVRKPVEEIPETKSSQASGNMSGASHTPSQTP